MQIEALTSHDGTVRLLADILSVTQGGQASSVQLVTPTT